MGKIADHIKKAFHEDYFDNLKSSGKYVPEIEPDNYLIALDDKEECLFYYAAFKPSYRDAEFGFHGCYFEAFKDYDGEMMSPKFLINGQGKDSVGEIFLEYRLGITDTGCGYPPHDTDRITIPVFVENVGGKPLYFRVKKGVIRIEPGERKRINGVGDEEYLPVPDDFDAEEAYAVVLLDFEDEFIDDKLLSQEEVNRLLNGCEEDGSSNYV